jgi:hypothetical protein
MAKVFYLRHQAAGILTQFPFTQKPTDAQLKAVGAICGAVHGENHPKTDEPYWLTVVEATMFGPTDIPEVPEPTAADERVRGSAAAGLGDVGASGVGHVKNR